MGATFEDHDVIGNDLRLSGRVTLGTESFHLGDEVTLAVRCEITKIHHEPVKDIADVVVRVHGITALEAAVVEDAAIELALRQARTAAERAAGIDRLPFDDNEGL